MYKKIKEIPLSVADWLDNGDIADMPFKVMEYIGMPETAEAISERLGLKEDELLRLAKRDWEEFRALLTDCGITDKNISAVWVKLIPLCREQLTEERLALLLRLIAGYEPDEDFAGYEDEDKIDRWFSRTQQLEAYTKEINMRKAKTEQWLSTLFKSEKCGNNSKCSDGSSSVRVFNMLCENGYADKAENKELLKNNLVNIADIIEGNPFLKPVEPLVYYQCLVRQRKKMLNSADYFPNIRNIFNFKEYSIDGSGETDHNRYGLHCELYVDVMRCFPKADSGICDEGFLRCSNLSDWFNVYSAEDMEIPLQLYGVLDDACIRVDVESSYLSMINAPIENVEQYKRKINMQGKGTLSEHYHRMHNSLDKLKFEDLERYIADGAAFFDEIWREYSAKINPKFFDVEQEILAFEIDAYFREMLTREIELILERYLVSEDNFFLKGIG